MILFCCVVDGLWVMQSEIVLHSDSSRSFCTLDYEFIIFNSFHEFLYQRHFALALQWLVYGNVLYTFSKSIEFGHNCSWFSIHPSSHQCANRTLETPSEIFLINDYHLSFPLRLVNIRRESEEESILYTKGNEKTKKYANEKKYVKESSMVNPLDALLSVKI